jgi:hypothetical protein
LYALELRGWTARSPSTRDEVRMPPQLHARLKRSTRPSEGTACSQLPCLQYARLRGRRLYAALDKGEVPMRMPRGRCARGDENVQLLGRTGSGRPQSGRRDPAVRLKRLWSTLADADLRRCIRPLIMDISAHAISLAERPRRDFGSPGFARAEKSDPIVVSYSRGTRWVKGSDYVIDSLLALRLPVFVPGGRSFVPTCGCRGPPRAGPVGVGRRTCLASRASVATPRLDSPVHGARIKPFGTRLHWS